MRSKSATVPVPVSGAGAGSGSGSERATRRARKRFARRQWARRWLAWRRVAAVVLVFGGIGTLVWLFYFSSLLAVSGVAVDGSSGPEALAVRRAAQVPFGSPLATVDLNAIKARVETLAVVKKADVSRSWPDQVRIEVTERTAVAVVERDGAFSALDAGGVLFKSYPVRPARLPVVHMSIRTGADALAEAAKVAGSLPAGLAAKVDYVDVGTIDTISLHLRNGKTILWGSADDSASKAKVIAVLLLHKASFYDVSVPGQPVLRR
jgi:cell division protein FtsQ